MLFGFCGSGEHTFLEVRHFERGDYEPGHLLHGKHWYGVDGTFDKTMKLSVNTSYVRSVEDTRLRLPVKPLCTNMIYTLQSNFGSP